jgi:hypothetical protein
LPFAEELAVAQFSNKTSHFDEQLCASHKNMNQHDS